MKNPGCEKCKWLDYPGMMAKCKHPKNIMIKHNYLRSYKSNISSPSKINQNRDCPLFMRKAKIITFFEKFK